MTLGIFTDDFYPYIGGIGRHVIELAGRLPQDETLVFSPCENRIPNHVKIRIPLHSLLRNLVFSLWFHRNAGRLIREYHLSMIHIHCGPGGLFLLKRLQVPVMATFHHTYWQQSHYIKSQAWKMVFVPLERRTCRMTDVLICVSENTSQVLGRRYPISQSKLVTIPNGVDRTKFYPIEPIKKLPNSILYVGRVDKRKGVDFLMNAMPKVVKELPEARLFVVGRGRDLPRLKREARTKGLERNVVFLGFLSDEELREFYNRAECLVVPSVFEGFGLNVIEAMACGTPVVVSDVDGLRELVQDDVNGLLVKYNDQRALSAKIITLLRNEDKKSRFAKEGLELVRKRYDWDKIAEDYKRVRNSCRHLHRDQSSVPWGCS